MHSPDPTFSHRPLIIFVRSPTIFNISAVDSFQLKRKISKKKILQKILRSFPENHQISESNFGESCQDYEVASTALQCLLKVENMVQDLIIRADSAVPHLLHRCAFLRRTFLSTFMRF